MGDPIEVGAAAAVLVDDGRRQGSVAASTAKSWIGHTEAAAGITGLAHAAAALAHGLSQGLLTARSALHYMQYSIRTTNEVLCVYSCVSSRAGILHLSAVNHHVKTILDISSNKSEGGPGWHMPRQTSSAAVTSNAVSGVSSFAFQGTNAHALLQQSQAGQEGTARALSVWSRQRIWVAPPAHIMLHLVVLVGQQPCRQPVTFEASLEVPQLAFLRDHRVLGMVMLPSTAFVEMGVGAQKALLNSNDLAASCLRSGTFITPMVFASSDQGARVRCGVGTRNSSVEISSLQGGQLRTHFYADVTYVQCVAMFPQGTVALAQHRCVLRRLLSLLEAPTARPAQASALIAVPQGQLGFAIHPAMSEASQHLTGAHHCNSL